MESIYWVMTWLCHRSCEHCYEGRFHPYQGEELDSVVEQSRAMFPKVIPHLPSRMLYRERDSTQERRGSIILAGGEILMGAVRESVLYPALRLLRERYREQGGVKLIVQTTGDLLTPSIVAELKALGVWTISVSGVDEFHAGMPALRSRIEQILVDGGFELFAPVGSQAREASDDGQYYHFFGATPDLWIGKLWPRGRALGNELSQATMADNFCAQWSGGKSFLDEQFRGSEVSIEPDGSVYPCCVKTKLPIGNVANEPLELILARHRGNPVYEAINAGLPQQMGLEHGWTEEQFLAKSRIILRSGAVYENLCVGCDRFHEEVLIPLAGRAPKV